MGSRQRPPGYLGPTLAGSGGEEASGEEDDSRPEYVGKHLTMHREKNKNQRAVDQQAGKRNILGRGLWSNKWPTLCLPQHGVHFHRSAPHSCTQPPTGRALGASPELCVLALC